MEQKILKLSHRRFKLPDNEVILDIQPIISEDYSYYAITGNGNIIEINTNNESSNIVFSIDIEELDFDKNVSIIISSDRNIIAAFNTFGRSGLVIDLQMNRIMMRFGRDDYHYEQTIFPISFVNHDGQVFIMHGTLWNRLDIINPKTGELLTARVDPETSEVHYLDYFHGQLSVSPDQEWVVDNGWEWHPTGSVTTWNIKQWITSNEWESEDGASRKVIWWGKEDWNDPICWISNTQVGISGKYDISLFDEEDIKNHHKDSVFRIFDVNDGSIIKEFEINYGKLFFDIYLFCSSQDRGFLIYDLSNGNILFEDNTIRPMNYHSKSNEFIEIIDNEIIISKLI
ncbi:hypothetical protein D7Z26_27020 [Cohnella endophytica]|uniref:WD40 repeat domain-containing protein n=1 Tax=Cohnella endophytica TaxID=2419778 RepID=A0A494X710_9BACL|nr:hypothetical protein [Cohnella endophytica]RKP44066.1 hypothetical protein D7Z26_27020 [Cohnella endophytica]